MAFGFGKGKLDNGKGLDLDDFDDDDFDRMFGEFDDNTDDRTPSKKKLAGIAAKSAASSIAEKNKEKFTEDFIPGDFNGNLIELKDLASHTKNLVSDSISDITDSLSKVLPERIREKLGLSSDSGYQQMSEMDRRNEEINANISSIFSNQKDISEAISSNITANRETAIEVTKLANAKLQGDILGRISNDQAKLTGFMIGVGGSYFRKSLELQYKSYYTGLDMLKVTSNYFKIFSTQFDSMVKNTSLPEYAKVNQSERIGGKFKDAMADKAFATMYTNNEFVQRIKKNIESRIIDYRDMIKDGIDSVGGAFEMSRDMGVSGSELTAKTGGGMIGGLLGDKLYKKLHPHLKSKLGNNEFLSGMGLSLENLVKNTGTSIETAKSRIKRGISENEDHTDLKGNIASKFWRAANAAMSLTERESRSTQLSSMGIDTFNQGAVFDNNVYRSITDSIPMFLSRILSKTSDLSQMYHIVNKDGLGSFVPSQELTYNYLSRDLTTVGEYRNSINTSIVSNKKSNMARGANSIIRSSMKGLNTDKKGNVKNLLTLNSGKAGELLSEYLETVAMKEGVDGNYDTLFTNALNDDADKNIKSFIKQNPAMVSVIEAINKGMSMTDNESKTNTLGDFNKIASDAASSYPLGTAKDFFGKIADLARPGDARNKPNDKEALIISKLWAFYIKDNDKPVINTDEVLKTVFSPRAFYECGFTTDDINIVSDVLTIFFRDCYLIRENGTYTEKQFAIGFFEEMNLTLMSKLLVIEGGVDKVKEQFETINRMHGSLLKNKSLSLGNMMGEGIESSIGPNPDMIDESQLAHIFDVSDVVVNEKIENRTVDKILKGIEDTADKYKEAFNSGTGIKSKVGNVVDVFTKDTKAFLNSKYEKLTGSFDSLGEAVKGLTNKTIDKAVIKLGIAIGDTLNDMESLIEEEEKDYQKTRNTLLTIANNVRSDTPSEAEGIQEQIRELDESRAKRKAAHQSLKSTLGSIRDEVSKLLEQDVAGDSINKAKMLYETLTTKVEELKVFLEITKKENV